MRDSRHEADRWFRQAENDLGFARLALPTRYPNGLPGGVPFEAFSQEQAQSAIAAAERFVTLARQQLSPNAE